MAGYSFDQDDVERTHSTVFATPYRGTTVGSDLRRRLDQDHQLYYARARWSEADQFFDDGALTISLQRVEETEDRIRRSGAALLQGFQLWTTGADLQLLSRTRFGTLTYGFDYYHDDVNSFGRNRAPGGAGWVSSTRGPIADDASYDLLGLYLQDELRPTPRLGLTAGLRYTSAWASANDVDPDPNDALVFGPVDEHWDDLVGSFGSSWEVWDGLRLFGSVAMGFRAPNLSDLTRFDVARSGEVERPAPDLEPEEYTQYEIGLKARAGRSEGQLAYFYTSIHNQIERFPTGEISPDGAVVEKANVGDGHAEGIELSARHAVGEGFSIFGSIAWIAGELDTFVGPSAKEERDRLSRLPPTTALLGLRWDSVDARYFAEATAVLVDEADRLSPEDERDVQRIPPGGLPGYTIYYLRGGARIAESLRLTAALENLTNKDYRILGSGLNEPGWNLVVGLDVAF